jgi:hypothetical protein
MSALALLLSSSIGRFAAYVAGGAIALAFCFGVGFYRGDVHRAALETAAMAAWQVKQNAAADAARKADAVNAANEKAVLQAQLKAAQDAVNAASNAACFDAPAADNLRSLWGGKNAKRH